MRVESDRVPAPPSAGDLSRDVLSVALRIRSASVGVLAEFGISDSQAGLLRVLDPAGEPQTQRALAARLTCDPSNITIMGDALQRAGLVERRSHPIDRRARVLALTARGRQAYERLRGSLEETSPFGRLDADQRRVLQDLLHQLDQPPG